MREFLLSREPSNELRIPCRLGGADRACSRSALSPGERELHDELHTEACRQCWLRGRAAWKRLLRELGEDPDTARFSLPSPRFSLTHAAGLSLVAGVPPGSALGVGIDLELDRAPSAAAARFFLTEVERRAVSALGSRELGSTLLRLWTIKEAVFKADPSNRGRILSDYRLAAPLAAAGVARSVDHGVAIRYSSHAVPGGFLTVAVLPSANPHVLTDRRERALAAQLL